MLSQIEIARMTEIFLWRPDVTAKDVEFLCTRAKEQKLYGVGVCSALVEKAVTYLDGSDCKVTALVSFPLGSMDADVKRYETEVAVDNGAHEVEVCLNIGALKDGDTKSMLRELRDINEAADERTVKAILDLPLLTPRENRRDRSRIEGREVARRRLDQEVILRRRLARARSDNNQARAGRKVSPSFLCPPGKIWRQRRGP